MKPPRGLTPEESALWQRLTASVVPLHPARPGARNLTAQLKAAAAEPKAPVKTQAPSRASGPVPPPSVHSQPVHAADRFGLDASWERKLARAATAPDFTLDLHGCTLDQAHARLDHGLAQAKAMGARLVLLITGKSRPVDPADRGVRRGAIRAKVIDWLAAGPHGSDIAAIRGAHRRHGGEGALYLVLRRRR